MAKNKQGGRRSADPKQQATPAAIPTPTTYSSELLEKTDGRDFSSFFKREDWWTFLATFALSTLVFFHHMAPEVTLQDSGELVTGAFTFGVPHPPGYPLWALLSFVWSHAIVPFGNPAWRIGLMSVFTGGLVVGVMALIMTRSTRILLRTLPWTQAIEERPLQWIALSVGASTALLFGFNRGVWLWACVSEMRVLNVLSFVLIGSTFFAWLTQPQRKSYLYATLVIFGLSMTNHQTVSVMAGALVAGTLGEGLDLFFYHRRQLEPHGFRSHLSLLLNSLKTFWELAIAVLFSASAGFLLFAWLRTPDNSSITLQPDFAKTAGLFLAGLALLIASRLCGWTRIRQALKYTLCFLGGCAFYLYMPIAAWTNPPMNWGYAGTKEGFLHAITRGQYEKLQTADLFSPIFLTKIKVFILGLGHQYSWWLCALGLVTLIAAVVLTVVEMKKHRWILPAWAGVFLTLIAGLVVLQTQLEHVVPSFWPPILWAAALSAILCLLLVLWVHVKQPGGTWMIFVWAAFFVTSLGLLTIINPKLDRQEQEITIKFFAPAHGFYAMLIGYGIAILYGFVLRRWPTLPRGCVALACVALLALPVITYKTNWSLCALETHDFGYQFGYRMFHPGGGYPDMERDSVLYGGTDPGRFVPTYMIFCESRVSPKNRFRDPAFDRSDVYIITQNALADNTYMSYIRDQYDVNRPTNNTTMLQRWLGRDHVYPQAPIFIPKPEDSAMAFQKYVEDVQAGRRPQNADLKIDNGRVEVSGALGVMEINGILAQWIFEKNKDKHAFYVEESYAIQWMYPYMRPFGVILKLEKDPVPSPQANPALWQDIIAKDKNYWDALTKEFLAREEFRRNNDAKKSFSKMRSAIAGLYLMRGLATEAEYAFKQSLDLCPESSESCFRLASLYMQEGRFDDARKLMEGYQAIDPYNESVSGFLAQIADTVKNIQRRTELEQKLQKGGGDAGTAMELLAVYGNLNLQGPFASLATRLLQIENPPPAFLLQLAQTCGNGRRPDLAIEPLRRYLAREPYDAKIWIELAFAQQSANQLGDAFNSLRKAIETGGDTVRALLRTDNRFTLMRQSPAFQALLQQTGASNLRLMQPMDSGKIGSPNERN